TADFLRNDGSGFLVTANYVTGNLNSAAQTDVFTVSTSHALNQNVQVYALKTNNLPVIDLNGFELKIGNFNGAAGMILNGGQITNGTINFTSEAIVHAGANQTSIISATVTGASGLAKYGPAILRLDAPGAWSGATYVAGVTVSANVNNAHPSGTNL